MWILLIFSFVINWVNLIVVSLLSRKKSLWARSRALPTSRWNSFQAGKLPHFESPVSTCLSLVVNTTLRFFPRFTWILVFSHSLITTLLTLLYHYTLHRLLNLIIVQFFFQFKVFVPKKHQPVHLLLLLTSMSTPALEQTQDSTSPLPSSSFHSVQHHKKSNDNFASSTFIVVVSLSS